MWSRTALTKSNTRRNRCARSSPAPELWRHRPWARTPLRQGSRWAMPDYQIFEAGDVVLQSGLTYRGARLAYKTYGALDTTQYFIIIPNMFGNGLSSSPSKTPAPFDRARYAHFTMTDNVRVQQRLLQEVFGIARVRLVYGFSMGAQQAFHWGALFPDRVERIVPICGSAKTSPHNF